MPKFAVSNEGLCALRGLAALAHHLRSTDSTGPRGIDALKRLAERGKEEAKRGFERCQDAVKQSEAYFPGLGEPLVHLDFTEHRWVGGHREEAYSDWLAWIVADLTPPDVLQIFGVRDLGMVRVCESADAVIVRREPFVEHGHNGCTGRLDIDIDFQGKARLVVEVKVTDAECADTAKHVGYRRSIEASTTVPFECVIVALSSSEEEYLGFRTRRWKDVCIELRLVAAELIGEHYPLFGSMTLSFVAAVEQNLLGFRVENEQTDSIAGLQATATAEHLQNFINRMVEKNP